MGGSACVCVRTQPSQPVWFNLPFYARIQRLDAEGGVGGGKLIAHSCVEGVLWAPEVLDKVQGLVYTKPANRLHRQRTERTFTPPEEPSYPSLWTRPPLLIKMGFSCDDNLLKPHIIILKKCVLNPGVLSYYATGLFRRI